VPTLLLQGGDSPDAFRHAGEALRLALPESRMAVMPGQRHAAMDTGTDMFVAQVLSFLDPVRTPGERPLDVFRRPFAYAADHGGATDGAAGATRATAP
jgi:hypothetical protein